MSAGERRLLHFGQEIPPVRRNKETKKPELFMAEGETHKNEKAYDSVHARIKRYQERYEAAQKKLRDVGGAGADRSKDISRPLNTLDLAKRDHKIVKYQRDKNGDFIKLKNGNLKLDGVEYVQRGGRIVDGKTGREVTREEERDMIILDSNNQFIEDEFGKLVVAGQDFNEVNKPGSALKERIFWRVAALERHYRDVEKIIADLEDKAGVDPGETLAAVNKTAAMDSLQKQFDAVNDQDKLETVHIDQYNNPFASREKGLYFLLRLPKDAEAKYVNTKTGKEFRAGREFDVSGGWKYYKMPDANMTGVDERTMQLKVTVGGEVRYATIRRIYENNLQFTFEKKPEPEPPTTPPAEEKPPVTTFETPKKPATELVRDEPRRPGLIDRKPEGYLGIKKEETDERSADEALEEILSDPTVETGTAYPTGSSLGDTANGLVDRSKKEMDEYYDSTGKREKEEEQKSSDEEGKKDKGSKEKEEVTLTHDEYLKKAEEKNPEFARELRVVEELLERLKKYPDDYEKQKAVLDGKIYQQPELLNNPFALKIVLLWLFSFEKELDQYERDHESTAPKPAETEEKPEESETSEARAASSARKTIKATPASMRTSDESSEVNTNQTTNETPNDVSQKEDASAGDKPNAKPEAESEQVAPKTEINKPPRPKEDWERLVNVPAEFKISGIPNGLAMRLQELLDRDREEPNNKDFLWLKEQMAKVNLLKVSQSVDNFFKEGERDLKEAARRAGSKRVARDGHDIMYQCDSEFWHKGVDIQPQLRMIMSAYGEIIRTLGEQPGEWTPEQDVFQKKLTETGRMLRKLLDEQEPEHNKSYYIALHMLDRAKGW